MIDLTSRHGRRINRRLRQERIIWLTTVDVQNTPQPRPVWFHWDGKTILIFSEKDKAKLCHIARNPRVAVNFNTDEDGGAVAVLIGDGKILHDRPEPNRVKAYIRKYTEDIEDLDMTVAEFSEAYAIPILITPQSMRGFVD
jgi:PPOX class probable F420-dependent enzyme